MKEKEKFHTFDALRFLSFFIVFISHLPYSLFPNFTFLKTRGDIGVYFFFTLSGFLITYILLSEKKETNTINFIRYLKRRVLRIWPLYYIILLFAFLTPYIIKLIGLGSTNIGYEPNWLFSCLFLENYMIMYYNDYGNISPLPVLWSLCIEEHFYIIWGIILLTTSTKKIPIYITSIIALSTISRIIYFENNILFKDILSNFDYFMYGAIPAYFYVFYKKLTLIRIQNISNWIKAFILIITALVVISFAHINFDYKKLIEPYIFGILFLCILLIMLPKENYFKISDSSSISKLGIYTYGLYLFHPIAINFFIQLYSKLNLELSQTSLFAFIFTGSLLFTIVGSSISYHIFEKQFLKLKNKI